MKRVLRYGESYLEPSKERKAEHVKYGVFISEDMNV